MKTFIITSTITIEAKNLDNAIKRLIKDDSIAYELAKRAEIDEEYKEYDD